MNFDVFNGDADGICALIQLRLAFPLDAQLVSGVKRDIDLLSRVTSTSGDQLTVLDISLDKNRRPLLEMLKNNVRIFFVDHHFSGEIPAHPCLTSIIDTDTSICTSLLINRHLQGRYLAWAVVGAFGDNLLNTARQAAKALHITESQLTPLQQLGICINYNAYGATVADLQIAPADLFRQLLVYQSPFDFMTDQPAIYQQLLTAYMDDMQRANTMIPAFQNENIAVFILPDEKWSRRVSGVWGNDLANLYPDRAHAVLSVNANGGYQVSVRAPLNRKTGADELCARFPSGGGRKAAAGINHLAEQQLTAFIDAFRLQYG
ncbi:MAG: DHH family phosphoesterase [Methylococcales bacterium]|nr:DHH family phosphoesterase [Methylococcales bacterium]